MKTAVVYYSMSGNCKFVAEQIATVLQCDQIRVEPVKSYPDKEPGSSTGVARAP